MQVHRWHGGEGADMLLDFFRFKRALNTRGDFGVKGLDAGFELEKSFGGFCD